MEEFYFFKFFAGKLLNYIRSKASAEQLVLDNMKKTGTFPKVKIKKTFY